MHRTHHLTAGGVTHGLGGRAERCVPAVGSVLYSNLVWASRDWHREEPPPVTGGAMGGSSAIRGGAGFAIITHRGAALSPAVISGVGDGCGPPGSKLHLYGQCMPVGNATRVGAHRGCRGSVRNATLRPSSAKLRVGTDLLLGTMTAKGLTLTTTGDDSWCCRCADGPCRLESN